LDVNERAPSELVDLERRIAPQQKRALARRQLILDATKRLLVGRSGEAITTSTVAAEAEVPVSSVYRYFPNIFSIHRTILEEFNAEIERIIGDILTDPEIQGWRISLVGMIGGLRELVEQNPSYGAVFRIMLTTHELRAAREAWNLALANRLAQRWHQGEDGFHGGDPDLVARMTVEIYCAGEVLIFERRSDPDKVAACFSETLTALERYLAGYLSDD
jgi:AcrR family transcriptional regulator